MMKKFILLLVLAMTVVTNGCYITNCPWGGKRSNLEQQLKPTHECRKCAGGLGTCFGSNICCGKEIGCLIDSPETLTCKLENRKTKPCQPYGLECKKIEYGRCATKNLCCNQEYCVPDSYCSSADEETETNNQFNDDKSHLALNMFR